MPSPLQPQSISAIGVHGVIRQAEVDDKLLPEGAVSEAMNFHFDRKGAATIRPGLAALGSTAAIGASGFYTIPCVGLHNAQAGTITAVFSNGNTSAIYTYNGTSWAASLDGGTASVRIRFIDFGSYTIALNFAYNTYTSIRFWNAGSSRHWHNTGAPINPQNMWGRACTLGEVYKSRVYLSGDTSTEGNKSRLYYSSVISSAGAITWSPTTDFVDINPGDGEDMTGLKRFSLELLCFKPNYIYRFRTSGTDPDPLIKIGTRSNESIVEGKRGLYFHHDTGIYRYSGGYPEEISRPIQDFIDVIPYSQYASIIAWKDNDHIYFSVGNLTIAETKANVTWKNVVLRYTESSNIWTIYSYPSEIRAGVDYTRGTTLSQLVGTDYGVVATLNSGTTDLGEPIRYRIRTKWYQWEGIANRKIIEELASVCEKAQGSTFMCQTDENDSWVTIGQLTKYLNIFRKRKIKFHRIRFQVTGVSKDEALIFQGLEILKGQNEGVVEL